MTDPKTAVEFVTAMRDDPEFAAAIKAEIHRDHAISLSRLALHEMGLPAPCLFCGSLDLDCAETRREEPR